MPVNTNFMICLHPAVAPGRQRWVGALGTVQSKFNQGPITPRTAAVAYRMHRIEEVRNLTVYSDLSIRIPHGLP